MNHLDQLQQQHRALKHALDTAGYSTPANGVSHEALTAGAYETLEANLVRYGNALSDEHRAALFALCGLFTKSAQHTLDGRWAFGLPTGMGKTSAIIAWGSTLVRLGLDHISVAVSASKVEALCDLKGALMDAGVPEERIGLLYAHSSTKHAYPPTDANDERQIMLVAHNRIRMSDGHERFMTYRRKPRDLLIWDESLIASEAKGFNLDTLDKAVGLVKGAWRRIRSDKHSTAASWLEACQVQIDQAIARAANTSAPEVLSFPDLDDTVLADFRAMLPNDAAARPVGDLLDFYREELRALPSAQGGGVVWYETTVPSEFRNIIVLDASYHIRKLCHADRTIRNAETHMPEVMRIGQPLSSLKRHDNVVVHQLFSGGGRSTMAKDFGDVTKQLAVKEVVEVVKNVPDNEAVLVFVFKDRASNGLSKRGFSYGGAIYRALAKAGIDTHAQLDTGLKDDRGRAILKARVNVATWGQETSLNRWAHCSNVVLCGVLQRSSLDLAGSYIGQTDNIKTEVTSDTIRDLSRSEVAHVVYQALSRGSSRVMSNGQAKPMKAWIIHRDFGLRSILEEAMPGIVFKPWKAEHIETTNADGSSGHKKTGTTSKVASRIVEYLQGLPPEVHKVSTKKLKVEADLREIAGGTFTDALRRVPDAVPWVISGRSLGRLFVAP